jgi:hypothetical protein
MKKKKFYEMDRKKRKGHLADKQLEAVEAKE